MKYEMKQSRIAGEWVVEAIGTDGEVYVAIFAGPEAKERASEYQEWKSKTVNESVTA
ncbi:MAG: hypothetical protein LZF62_320017 [Nitrospira sp.]|nr:MAG: hypothetical protein LZF62_320017 [Nitrospira sp.]